MIGFQKLVHFNKYLCNNTFVDVANQIKDLEARLQMLHRTTSDDNTATHGRIDRLVKLQKDFAEDMAQGRSESKRDARQARDDTRCAVAAAVREARTISSRMEQLSSAIPVDLSGSASTGLQKCFLTSNKFFLDVQTILWKSQKLV